MFLALMDNTVRGVFYLVAIVLFIIAALAQDRLPRIGLVALGLASFVIPFCWDAFAA
jgi:hypothetical protein